MNDAPKDVPGTETGMAEAEDAGAAGGFRLWMLVPALGALAVMAVFLLGLEQGGESRDLPSPLIGKEAPQFDLPPLFTGGKDFSTADLKAPGVKLVNVWASWCVPCRAEVPVLMDLKAKGVTLYAINYKDKQAAAEKFLADLGNPFTLIGADTTGRVGIDWGVYGVPETFVVDGKGKITYKHVGPIQGDDMEKRILPAIARAKADG